MTVDVAVVILTFNEELNVPFALKSVVGWAREVFIFDSLSTDRTVPICIEAGCHVVEHLFEDYSKQRNCALKMLPITATWVLFLDADELLTEDIKDEISKVISSNPPEDGFFLNRRLLWMGKWIRRGYYPVWILRLFRRGRGWCDQRSCNEHIVVEGTVGYLRSDFIHEDRKGISDWIAKHNGYATREAHELLTASEHLHEVPLQFWGGSPVERSRWLRYKVWNRLPLLVRPILYFFFRVIIRGGIFDGRRAIVYHFLHALWYPILIDLKYLEMVEVEKRDRKRTK